MYKFLIVMVLFVGCSEPSPTHSEIKQLLREHDRERDNEEYLLEQKRAAITAEYEQMRLEREQERLENDQIIDMLDAIENDDVEAYIKARDRNE